MGLRSFGFLKEDDLPQWQVYLERASDYVIDQTGLYREKLKEVLDVLYENRIINWVKYMDKINFYIVC